MWPGKTEDNTPQEMQLSGGGLDFLTWTVVVDFLVVVVKEV
jgi:hypothetical protein